MKLLMFSREAISSVALALSVTLTGVPSSTAQAPSKASQSTGLASYDKLPLLFEKNDGQTDRSVQFLSRGQGYTLFLRQGEAVVGIRKAAALPEAADGTSLHRSEEKSSKPGTASGMASDMAWIRMELVGRNPLATAIAESRQITTTNYFLGSNPALWRTGISNYGRIRYRSIYNGIDQVYYGNQRQLEHDFIVQPQADPGQIVLRFTDTQRLAIDSATGDLVLGSDAGELRLRKPLAYQENGRTRTEIPSQYKLLAANEVSFSIGKYDRARELVIDPVLTYSTYLGGTGAGGDQGNGIAVDAAGEAVIVGTTYSADFPVTSGALQGHSNAASGLSTVFVTKLNATGTAQLYSTFLGGSGGDFGYGIALDTSNNVYVTGATRSTDFPVVCGAYQATSPSKNSGATAGFVARLVADGSALSYSTYLGGSGNAAGLGDVAQGIAVDGSGNAYVAGYTYSADFPVSAAAFQATYKGSAYASNAFVVQVNPTGTALPYSTYLGGSGGDFGNAIAIDGSGNAYVTGTTGSTDFPISAGAYQTFLRGATNAFVTELNAGGSTEVYSTYLGGSGQGPSIDDFYAPPATGDMGTAITVDASGSAYVAGVTTSADFPVTAGVLQGASKFDYTGSFVTKLNAGGATLGYSTYVEGVGTAISGLAVDAAGNAYLTGYVPAVSAGQPGGFLTTTDGLTAQTSSGNSAFVVKLDPAATVLNYATLLGGSSNDLATGIALDTAGNAYVTGNATSADFPITTGAFQTTNHGATTGGNAFASQLSLASEANATGYPAFPTGIPTTMASTGSSIILTNCQVGDPTSNAFQLSVGATLTSSAFGPPLTGQFTFTDSFNYMYPTPYRTEFFGSWGVGAVDLGFTDGESFDGPIGPFSVTWTVSYSGDPVYAPSSVSGTVSSAGCPTSNATPMTRPANLGRHVELKSAAVAGGIGISNGVVKGVSQSGTSKGTTVHGVIRIRGAKFTPSPLDSSANGVGAKSKSPIRSQDSAPCVQPPQVGAPIFSQAAGTYTSIQSVTLTDATAGAAIYYTTDGSTPSASSTRYSGAISVGVTETIQAIAVASGYTNSAVTAAAYVINLPPPVAATPVFSVAAGSYTSIQSVTISDATAGAAIYYTTDGSTPSASSTRYAGAISVSVTETIQAIAIATGYSNSSVASAAYIINLPQAAAPVFSVAAGTYTSVQSVTLSDTTAGASIYYTTDGSTPSASATPYTGAISVGATETIQAIAIASGYTNSAIASAAYVINLPPATFAVTASPSSLTISRGGSGTATISITPQNGFAAATSFSCTGLAVGETCTFAPATVTPTAGIATTTLTIAVSANAASLPSDSRSPLSSRLPGATLAIAFCYFGWRKRRSSKLMLLALVTVSLGATVMLGCGGKSKPTTSTVTVIATSGSIQQNVPLIVTIQ